MRRDLLFRSLVMMIALVFGANMLVKAQVATPRTTECKFIEGITVDADMEAAWDDAVEETLNYDSGGADLPDPTDRSGTFRTAWDNDFIYFFFDLKDDVLIPWTEESGKAEYETDNVEVFFNMDLSNDNEDGSYTSDAIQLRFNQGLEDNHQSNHGNWKGSEVYADDGWEYMITETGEGYVLEAKIPWVGIRPEEITIEEGLEFGFEVSFGDADDETNWREGILTWANDTGADNSWQDTRCFGVMKLVGGGGAVDPGTGIAESASSNIQIAPNPVNNLLKISGVANQNIAITNLMGQLVMEINAAAAQVELDVAGLQSGIYLVNVNGAIKKFVKK